MSKGLYQEPPARGDVAFDGTFDGLLCVVAHALETQVVPLSIVRSDADGAQGGLFGAPTSIATDARTAADVEERLARRGRGPMGMLYRILLSEQPGCDRTAVRLGLALIAKGRDVLDDVGFEPSFEGQRLSRMVGREIHRMHAFVRFERDEAETDRGGLPISAPDDDRPYIAFVEPAVDALPLSGDHFVRRFPAMRWAILDTQRRYGLVWDRERLSVRDDFPPSVWERATRPRASESERLWRAYFRSVDIPERRNPDLQRRHMPKRYWRYLPEATEIQHR